MAHGHMIPLYDIARLFAARGVKSTLITTPTNATTFPKSDNNIELKILRFSSEEVGLPTGIENLSQLTEPELMNKFIEAMKVIAEGPLQQLLSELRPSCLVADFFVPWTADVAFRVGIPWVGFHSGGYFALSVSDSIRRHRPQWTVESESEEFVVPEVNGNVRLSRRKLSPVWLMKAEEETENSRIMEVVEKAFEVVEERCFGVIANSFYEMEKDYVDYYQKVIGKRCWCLGPLSLCFRNIEQKTEIDVHECLNLLDSKPPNSVIYVCFGSIAQMSYGQLTEIAMALEASEQNFIWVVRQPNLEEEEWLPSGFEEKNKGKGLIIRGWAPQVMILDHRATGGFVTHCGWNSTLEGVSAGIPMVTWPMFAEQFMNEIMITDVLRVGISIGAKQNCEWMASEVSIVGRAVIEEAVRRVMAAEEMRSRAAKLKELAWKAVQEGGSSHNDLSDLLALLTLKN